MASPRAVMTVPSMRNRQVRAARNGPAASRTRRQCRASRQRMSYRRRKCSPRETLAARPCRDATGARSRLDADPSTVRRSHWRRVPNPEAQPAARPRTPHGWSKAFGNGFLNRRSEVRVLPRAWRFGLEQEISDPRGSVADRSSRQIKALRELGAPREPRKRGRSSHSNATSTTPHASA
jgi:hypothetical protein